MKLFRHQLWHLLLLLLLTAGIYQWIVADNSLLDGELWGLDTGYWLVFAFMSPVLHQFYVMLCWRFELYRKSLSRAFGDNGFKLFKIGFAALILSRPLTLVLLAISNAETLAINPVLGYLIGALLLMPGIYLMVSVKKYFGFDRAFGIDHFEPEKYRNVPMVRKGIFKYSSNGMYVFGFCLLWAPGFIWQSKAALVLALFNHLYIWVHYYFTEKPDMEEIYGKK